MYLPDPPEDHAPLPFFSGLMCTLSSARPLQACPPSNTKPQRFSENGQCSPHASRTHPGSIFAHFPVVSASILKPRPRKALSYLCAPQPISTLRACPAHSLPDRGPSTFRIRLTCAPLALPVPEGYRCCSSFGLKFLSIRSGAALPYPSCAVV